MNYKQLADGTDLVLASSWMTLLEWQFSGVAYMDDAVVVGSAGMHRYCAQAPIDAQAFTDGRFALFARAGSGYIAKTDALGQDSIFYYSDERNWALSNSFYALCQHLKEHGARLTPYVPALSGFFVEHSVTHQLISNRTGVSEIRVLPADSSLMIAPHTAQVWVRRTHTLDYEQTTSRGEYEDRLVAHAAKWASRTHALIDAYGESASIDVTGGMDSRLVLGLVLAGGADLSRMNVVSNPKMPEDFAVAQALADANGFTVQNRPHRLVRPSTETDYALWKYGNLGVYLNARPALSDTLTERVHFHGACGECYRDFYRGTALNLVDNIASRVPDTAKQMLRNEFTRGFDEAHVSGERAAVVMDHYRHFRSRFHFGRNWFRSLQGVLATPLASMDLVKASGALTKMERDRNQLFCDMLLLSSPALATAPFDKPSKAFSQAALEASPFYRHRPAIEPLMRQMKVYRGSLARTAPTATTSTDTFHGVMGRDVDANLDRARSLGIFTRDYEDRARAIAAADKVTAEIHLAAAHIVTAGEIVSVCES